MKSGGSWSKGHQFANYTCEHCGKKVRGGANALGNHMKYDCIIAQTVAVNKIRAARGLDPLPVPGKALKELQDNT